MVVISFSDEIVSQVSAARLFRAGTLDAHNIFPKLCPDLILSGAIIEGDGGSGTVKEYRFSKSAGIYSYVRERHYVIDKENLEDKWTWSEGGDMGTKLKSYDAWCKFEPTSNGGCIYKCRVEYEPVDGVDYFEGMKVDRDIFMLGLKSLEAYLLANPEAYA